MPLKQKKGIAVKVVSWVALALILSSVLINWITWGGKLWCVTFSAYVLYVWLLGLLTFKRGVHPGLKLMTHAIALTLLLVVTNMFAYSKEIVSRVSWAVSFAMPFILIGFMIAIDVLILLRRTQNRRDYLLYQISLSVIGFIPIILVLSGVAQPVYPSIIAASCSFLTILGMVIFARKIVFSEFGRKFHI